MFELGAGAYKRAVFTAATWKGATLAAFALALVGAFWLYRLVPRGFIPEEDQGYLIIMIQTPQGASLEYTKEVSAQVEAVLSEVPEINGAFTVVGFGVFGSAPNRANTLVNAGNQDKNLAGLVTAFTANDPQYLVKIDRDRAKSLQVPFSQVTDALQVFMGSVYVNDFDFNNRSYRVYLQADQKYRAEARDIRTYYLRSDTGRMIPLDNLVEIEQTANPQVISHFNLFRSAEISGSAAPGVSTGQALAAMEAVARKEMPRGMGFEWSGLSLEEVESSGKAVVLFALGLIFVYLTLAAQYESYVLPFIVLLGVPVSLLGALGATALRGLTNDVYCQIGLVMLIGLASKNAILIVEFAERLEDEGLSTLEAAVEAARIRLRPILMTSLAFMLGVVPLMIAKGAGAAGRVSVGTTVFGGMLAATTLNLLFIPTLYVVVRGLVPRKRATEAVASSETP